MAKASDNEFPSVLFGEQASAPATPAAGTVRLFHDDAGNLKVVDDAGTVRTLADAGADVACEVGIAASDESTAIDATGTKVTFRMPYAMTVTEVRASLTTADTTGITVDLNEGGTSILSTKVTVDANEKTSTTAATPAVISDPDLADDAEITVDVDAVGAGVATGLKVWLIGTRA